MVPSLQVEYAPSSSSTLSEDQFKIVIGNKPTSSSVTDKYTINLDDLNSQPEVSLFFVSIFCKESCKFRTAHFELALNKLSLNDARGLKIKFSLTV